MRLLEKIYLLIGAIVIIGLILTLPTLWLWNWLMPTIFGLTKLIFWKALGINLLAGILFRSNSNNKD